MMNYPPLSPAPNKKETLWGYLWLAASMLVLSTVLVVINVLLGSPLSIGMINVVYYIINFLVTVLIFRRFLTENAKAALQRPFAVIWYAVLGYLGYMALTELLTTVLLKIYPDFSNVNDDNISTMLQSDMLPLGLSIVFLVPLAEETIYRGLIFRKLFDKHPVAAYLVSMTAFAAIHVMGYIGSYSATMLLLCFVQYLPAAYCLAWCYRQTGTIITPIVMHTLVNGISVYYLVR